ncbi:TonB family protein [Azonexus sp. R2A61]|uniref:TonB family protein n=1 Tax=Azonexus sp. R2A61 TaxID=2744443 RepID=UPI001F18BC44|nr:TonB family protein [Azonexus sp. R2A61]
MSHARSYAEQQRDPRKHLVGTSAVVLFHIILVYGLMNGLGRKVVEVLKSPLEVSIVEEIKPPPPPPPPPKVVRQIPKTSAPPPPAYVPQTETVVQAPVPPITTTAEVRPEPPPAPPAPPAPVQPAQVNISVACPNYQSIPIDTPKQALRLGLSGQVTAEFTVGAAGEIRNIAIVQSSNSIFNAPVTAAIARYRCIGQGRDVRVRVPFVFRSE